ncbi:hypothetical protein [Pseudorhodoplanes sp.]|uniref:hypothetical protein n=1 Tax=Pseudorhodoplanes sp. TaxID=1934341 RepID=UPI00391A616E
MLKKIAIDVLLRWAFTVELPKGHPVEASAWELMARAAVVRVAGSAHGGGMGVVPGDPHDDALALAAAVRKLPRAHRLGAARVARLCGDFAALDDAAIEAVGSAPFNLPALIIRGAVLKSFEWDIGEPSPQPMRREFNDKPIVFGTDRKSGALTVAAWHPKSHRYPPHLTDLHCPVLWLDPSVGELAEARGEYAAWHDALLMIRDAVRLAEHDALLPSVAAEPWRAGVDVAPATVWPAGDHAAPGAILPLAPRRKAALPPLKSDAEMLRIRRARDKAKETRRAKTA